MTGMFVISAAAAEATAATAAAALARLRVGDVMTPDPDTGATWMNVQDFIEQVALHSEQAGFPVIGPGGSPTRLGSGLLGLTGRLFSALAAALTVAVLTIYFMCSGQPAGRATAPCRRLARLGRTACA
jgi:hypothetical protein